MISYSAIAENNFRYIHMYLFTYIYQQFISKFYKFVEYTCSCSLQCLKLKLYFSAIIDFILFCSISLFLIYALIIAQLL